MPVRDVPAHSGRDPRSGEGDRMITIEKTSSEGFVIENVSRRNFLQGMLSASAFVLCVEKAPLLANAARNGAPIVGAPVVGMGSVPEIDATAFHPGVFLGIQSDGSVFIVAHRTEMGNGVRTSLPRIVADELDADWVRVKVIQGDGDERYGSQDTDGSHSVREFFDTMREAGATARLMLIRAAAQQWAFQKINAWPILRTASRTKGRIARSVTENSRRSPRSS